MLRDQTDDRTSDRPSSRTWRVTASLALLGLTVGVALLRGPVRGADDERASTSTAKSSGPAIHDPITPVYVPDYAVGLVAFRPASLSRRTNFGDSFWLFFSEFSGVDIRELGKKLNVDEFGLDDIEWATCGIHFGYTKTFKPDLHNVGFSGLTLRTFAPFDWLAYLRQWRLDFTEIREGGRSYYRIKDPMRLRLSLGDQPCIYLPDDRTLVLDEEECIRPLVTNTMPAQRAYLRGQEWERASRGLLAVAIDNEEEAFVSRFDLGRTDPDDAFIPSLFKGVDRWVFGLDDAAVLNIHASAACRDADAGAMVALAVDTLSKLGKNWVEHADPDSMADVANVRNYLVFKAFLEGLVVNRSDRSIDIHAKGFGTLADLGSIIEAEFKDERSPQQAAADKSKSTKR